MEGVFAGKRPPVRRFYEIQADGAVGVFIRGVVFAGLRTIARTSAGPAAVRLVRLRLIV